MDVLKLKLGELQRCGVEIFIVDPCVFVPFPGEFDGETLTFPADKASEVMCIINDASDSAYELGDQEVCDALTRLYCKISKMCARRGILWHLLDYADLMAAADVAGEEASDGIR